MIEINGDKIITHPKAPFILSVHEDCYLYNLNLTVDD